MEAQLYPLGFDPTGSDEANLVLEEYHKLPAFQSRPKRAVILEKGYFYVDSVSIKNTAGQHLVKGKDYIITGLNGEASAKVGKAIACIIVILTNVTLNRIYVDAQMVGGEYCFVGELTARLLSLLKTDTRTIDYRNIEGVPNTLKSTRHKHSLAQTYGWEVFETELKRITKAIITNNQRDMKEVAVGLTQKSDDATSRIQSLEHMIDTHIADLNNPHKLTLEQVKLEYYAGRFVVEASQIYDGFIDDCYLTPAAIRRYLLDQAYAPFKEHVASTNNPHRVTLKQLAAMSSGDIDGLVDSLYQAAEQVVNAVHLENYTYTGLIEYLRSNLDASRVMNGVVDPRRLGTGTPTETSVLVGSKWVELEDVFKQYSHPKPKLLYTTGLGSAVNDTAINKLKERCKDITLFPVGTGVLYNENYTSYNDIGPSIWRTTGSLMQLAIRKSQDEWIQVRTLDHDRYHDIEDASTDVWWF